MKTPFTLSQVIAGAFALIVVVAGGTFTLTTYSSSQQTELLKLKNKELIKELRVEKNKTNDVNLKANFNKTNIIPEVVLNQESGPELKKLALRISDLEKERANLLSRFADQSIDKFNPKGEVSKLIIQLNSSKQEMRLSAVKGLFNLKDKQTFSSLVAYFHKYPEEATRSESIVDWIWFLFDLDEIAGTEFAIQLLESDISNYSEIAYQKLEREIKSKKAAESAVPLLRSIALQSSSSLSRTRAKILLRTIERRIKEKYFSKDHDERSLFRVLLDIEKLIKNMTKSRARR